MRTQEWKLEKDGSKVVVNGYAAEQGLDNDG
jgi:hypothetical protein